MLYRAAVIGDSQTVMGFKAVGLTTAPANDGPEAAAQLHKLAENGYAVIYITEALAEGLSAELDHYRESLLPAIIPIPGVQGNTGMGIRMVKHSVEQAVGSDIIFNDN